MGTSVHSSFGAVARQDGHKALAYAAIRVVVACVAEAVD
jgi:hypothetical protein